MLTRCSRYYRDLLAVAQEVAEGYVDSALGNVRERVLKLAERPMVLRF